MQRPLIPSDDVRRLSALRALSLLDAGAEERFDRITRLARTLFGVPQAEIRIEDGARQGAPAPRRLVAGGLSTAPVGRGTSPRDDILVVEDSREEPGVASSRVGAEGTNVRFYAVCPLRSPDGIRVGSLFLADTRPRSFGSEQRRQLEDLAALVEREFESTEEATVDALTGLTNRRGFDALARHTLASARRDGRPVTLVQIDLDGFKLLNDTYGHAAGDQALRDFGAALLEVFRDSDVVARMGGDEFTVIMSGATAEQVERPLAEVDGRLARLVAQGAPPVGYSVGVATRRPGQSISLTELLSLADKRMYLQKRGQRAAGA